MYSVLLVNGYYLDLLGRETTVIYSGPNESTARSIANNYRLTFGQLVLSFNGRELFRVSR